MTEILIDGEWIEVGPLKSPLRPGDNRVTQAKILRQLEREGVLGSDDYNCEMLYISGAMKILAYVQQQQREIGAKEVDHHCVDPRCTADQSCPALQSGEGDTK